MFSNILTEGLIFGIMVLGVFISYRVLNFCDMTVDGAFPMGGCIFAVCMIGGLPSFLSLLFAFIGGAIAGLCTTVIYTKLKIPDLLAGILVMTILYSINLRIMGNRANVSFLKLDTLFKKINLFMEVHFPLIQPEWGFTFFLIIFVFILSAVLIVFFHTDLGLTMGALGANEQMVVSLGVNPDILRGIGVCFGDGLAALSGAFFSMYQGFADVGSGTGIIVSGLASLMLGEFIIRSNRISLQILRVLIGSLVYRALMYFARSYGHLIKLNSNDLKLITGVLIIICLIVANLQGKWNFKEHVVHPKSRIKLNSLKNNAVQEKKND